MRYLIVLICLIQFCVPPMNQTMAIFKNSLYGLHEFEKTPDIHIIAVDTLKTPSYKLYHIIYEDKNP